MKTIYVVLPLMIFTLMSCREFVAWDDFPEERFKSYMPYSEKQKLVFEDKSGMGVEYIVTKNDYSKTEFKATPRCDCLSYLEYNSQTHLMDRNNNQIDYRINLYACAEDYFDYDFMVDIGLKDDNLEFFQDYKYGVGSHNRREINNILSDTIKMSVKMPNNIELGRKDYAVVVAGKGIVEMVVNGEKYTLVEE